MVRVKFLKDTRHPDYGEIEKGEVLEVSSDYARDYEEAGLAKESDERVSRQAPKT